MPEPIDQLRLAELLCARISHDLSGLIGTLAGALEMADDPAVAGEAVSVAHQAALELRYRLELQRACWGPDGGALDLAALRGLAEGLPQGKHCTVNLAALPADTLFSPAFARMVLNLLLLATESLKGGGEIVLTGSGTDLIIAIAGPHAAWPNNLAACLTSETAAWAALRDARSMLMPLTALLARALGLRLSMLMPAGAPGRAPPPLRLTLA
jgi:histidine phosphotransferase ChpT